ncbi:MAG: glycosyltransferase family 39 protein [Acidobacteriota bacterium]|nr:glycosyltransferase family 39 protein [Acidobacteriota bacterium]
MGFLNSRRLLIAGLAVIVTLLAAVNVYYFHLSQTPTFWDDSSYLIGSLDLFDALTSKSIPGFATTFAHLYGNKAPLICVFPVPIYALFGREYDPRCLVGIAFLILMSIYIFRLGECLWSSWEGLLAVVIAQTMPLLYGLSRQFLVDYGLTAMVVMWMYYLLCSRRITAASAIVPLGLLLGFGVLMKVTFPLYIVPATALVIISTLWRARDWANALRVAGSLLAIGSIGAVIASSWYITNLKTVLGFAVSAGFGKLSVSYGNTNVFAWDVVSAYLFQLAIAAVSGYYAVLSIAILPAWAASAWRKHTQELSRALPLLLWLLVPLAVTTFAINKDPRYTAPLLPALALLLARMLRAVLGRWRLRSYAIAVLLVIPVLAYASASLPIMERFGSFAFGRWIIWSPHVGWFALAPGSAGAWDQKEIFRDVCRDAQQAPPGSRLFIPLAHQYLNNVNLAYLMKRMKCNVEVIGLPPPLQTSKEVSDFIETIKPLYVVVVPDVPEPQLAPKFANVMKEEAERLVTRPGSDFCPFLRRSAGNTGKEIQIYRRK